MYLQFSSQVRISSFHLQRLQSFLLPVTSTFRKEHYNQKEKKTICNLVHALDRKFNLQPFVSKTDTLTIVHHWSGSSPIFWNSVSENEVLRPLGALLRAWIWGAPSMSLGNPVGAADP